MYLLMTLLLSQPYYLPTHVDCNDWAEAAEKTMRFRQEHVSSDTLFANLAKSQISANQKEVATAIITAAYKVEIINEINGKLFLIKKFGDAIFIECLKVNQKES